MENSSKKCVWKVSLGPPGGRALHFNLVSVLAKETSEIFKETYICSDVFRE